MEVLYDRDTSEELLCLMICKEKATKFCNSIKAAFSLRTYLSFPSYSCLLIDLMNKDHSFTLLII